jgi:titin
VQGNLIGVDSSGAAALGNGDDGVALLSGASNNTIGGTTNGAANTIAANKRYGVLLGVSGTNSNLVVGNFIGTNGASATGLGNQNDGVEIVSGAAMNAIGGTATGAGNTIAGNVGNGVLLASSGTTGNLIQGNFIGTDSAGTVVLGNSKAGVIVINSAANNQIGAQSSASPTGAPVVGGNIIANNSGSGVIIGNSPTDTGAVGNAVVGNTIYANGGASGIGIDLGNQGKPATQPAGPGPNNFQPAPTITSATLATGGALTINFSLTAPAGTYRLEFFLNNSTDAGPQGRFFLGSQNVTVATTGTPVTGSFVFTPTAGTGNLVPATGQLATATATRLTGAGNGTPSDTSEFSSGATVVQGT